MNISKIQNDITMNIPKLIRATTQMEVEEILNQIAYSNDLKISVVKKSKDMLGTILRIIVILILSMILLVYINYGAYIFELANKSVHNFIVAFAVCGGLIFFDSLIYKLLHEKIHIFWLAKFCGCECVEKNNNQGRITIVTNYRIIPRIKYMVGLMAPAIISFSIFLVVSIIEAISINETIHFVTSLNFMLFPLTLIGSKSDVKEFLILAIRDKESYILMTPTNVKNEFIEMLGFAIFEKKK